MGFKITIEETTREQVKTKEYVATGTKADGETDYGYATKETTEDITREVYSQRVDNLDLVAVINAVNAEEK